MQLNVVTLNGTGSAWCLACDVKLSFTVARETAACCMALKICRTVTKYAGQERLDPIRLSEDRATNTIDSPRP